MRNLIASFRNYFRTRQQIKKRQSLPHRLHGPLIYIFPTRYGFVFFFMLLAILFGSINHNNNMGFLITFLLGGMSFVSILHTYRNLTGLTVASARTRPVFASQPATFELQIIPGSLSRSSISLSFHNQEGTILDLRKDSSKSVNVIHHTERRGILKPDRLFISTTYPLGLFRAWSHVFVDAPCLVYPKPLAGPLVMNTGRKDDDHAGETGGPGVDDFAGLDTYQPGDPLQHINWKVYSRGQGLYVKKFEGQPGKTIYFDPSIIPGRNLEKKLSRICHMILKADAMRLAYGLRLGKTYMEPGTGNAHKQKCLKMLAVYGKREE